MYVSEVTDYKKKRKLIVVPCNKLETKNSLLFRKNTQKFTQFLELLHECFMTSYISVTDCIAAFI